MLIRLAKTDVKAVVVPELRRPTVPDWKDLQQRVCYFDDIKADAEIKRFISAHQHLGFDTDWAAPDIKRYAAEHVPKGRDFFIITDREFAKRSLEQIEHIIHGKMAAAKLGGYVSLLSYYLNWHDERVDKTLPETLSTGVHSWIASWQYRFDDVSQIIDYPIFHYDTANYSPTSRGLLEGKNFLFSHPNVRVWLWK